jgi:hypothetical protein
MKHDLDDILDAILSLLVGVASMSVILTVALGAL